MDRIKKYETAILDFLKVYAKEMYDADPSDIETLVVADKENYHYQLVRVGWAEKRQVHYTPIHIDIKNNKVWIQINNTEELVADELVNRGLSKQEIVLAFHPKELREFTGFAVA